MAKAEGWERLGELSRLLQAYRRMYVCREVEQDNPSLLNWRSEVANFLKVMWVVTGLLPLGNYRCLPPCRRLQYSSRRHF